MVELRKRKAPAEAAPAPPPKKSSNPVKKALNAAKDAVIGNSASSEGATNGSAKIAVGQTIALEGFGGELETHTGDKVTLSKLLEQSQAGVVIFTYPKANTPGCKLSPFSTCESWHLDQLGALESWRWPRAERKWSFRR
jgi:peroxiredoxin Q/BCP